MSGAVDLSGGTANSGGGPASNANAAGGAGYVGGAAPAYGAGGGGFGDRVMAGMERRIAQHAVQAVQDPGVQGELATAAYDHANQGLSYAREGLADAVQQFGNYVQEGPAGVSVLCFLGGLATTLVGILGLLSIATIEASPFQYVLNGYLTLFGVVTFLLEADVESVRRLKVFGRLAPWIERYQMEVFNRANFLTELRGRAFFYIFVGLLAVTQCAVCLLMLAGLWNLVMGGFCLCMSFGVQPVLPFAAAPPGEAQAQHAPLTSNAPPV